MEFTEEQISRYSRHILLPEVGGKGQRKIAKAKILVVGAGGLGSPAALYLAAAGVGRIGLIDSDVVDLTNLQRQILHHTRDVGRPKVLSGKEKIQALNPDVTVSMYEERLTAGNALKLFSEYDVIIDGVDNFTAKFLINDACFFTDKPLVHGGILRCSLRVGRRQSWQAAVVLGTGLESPPTRGHGQGGVEAYWQGVHSRGGTGRCVPAYRLTFCLSGRSAYRRVYSGDRALCDSARTSHACSSADQCAAPT